MNKPKFTPGPWVIANLEDNDPAAVAVREAIKRARGES